MKKKLTALLRQRRGMTLMEVMCATFLLVILIEVCASALHPAARVMRRTRKVADAQVIAESVLESIRAEVEEAQEYIKIYAKDDQIADTGGVWTPGEALEFVASNGYTMLISAGGCDDTKYVEHGVTPDGSGTGEIENGRLFYRWYFADPETHEYTFSTTGGGSVARAAQLVFPEEFYMGMHIKLSFSQGMDGDKLNHVKITVAVYNDEDVMTDGTIVNSGKICQESVIADLRHAAVLKDGKKQMVGMYRQYGVTAKSAGAAPTPEGEEGTP